MRHQLTDADWIARHRMAGLGVWRSDELTPGAAVGRLVAMQAQEHPYARWSVAQRMTSRPTASQIDVAFDDGAMLRTHVLRPTWHYVAPDDLSWLLRLSGPRVHAWSARRYTELGLDDADLRRSADVIGEAVRDRPRTRRELADELEREGLSTTNQRLAYMVMYAELHRVVCSGAMRGKQHTYAAFADRVGDTAGPDGDDALAELAHRYFSTRGPATVKDFAWWAGLRAGDARRGLELCAADLDSRDIDGRAYWYVDSPVPRMTGPRVDLVQCYDETIISYTESRDVLQSPAATFKPPARVDGFVHVLLLDGRLLGHWRPVVTKGAVEVETRIDADVDVRTRGALAEAVDRYVEFASG